MLQGFGRCETIARIVAEETFEEFYQAFVLYVREEVSKPGHFVALLCMLSRVQAAMVVEHLLLSDEARVHVVLSAKHLQDLA